MTGSEVFGPEDFEAVVAAAARAPSILNCQPWRFHVHDDLVDLYVDPDQAPTVLDPTGREVFISLGAALLNLRLAVAARGRAAAVQLLPSISEPTFVARLRVGGPAPYLQSERLLHDAIPVRQCSRVPFTAEQVQYEDFMHLQEAASVEGGRLDSATGAHRFELVGLLHDADATQRDDPALVESMSRWVGDERQPGAGIPAQSLGPVSRHPSSVVRDLALGRPVAGRGSAEFESSGLLATLLTTGDHPIDWVRAGLALERVLLTATVRGLSAGILSQATEVPALRSLVRDPSSRWSYPQVVLRFGYGPPMPPTHRRPMQDILRIEPA